MCVVSLVSSSFAQSNESKVGISLLNTIYPNKVHSEGPSDFTEGRATFGQSVLVEHTREVKSNLLFSVGVEFGYQPYSFVTNFPFQQLGFIEPTNKGEQYTIKEVMYFVRPNLVIGYRFNSLRKLTPEIRLGHMFHIPINQKSLDVISSEHYSKDVAPERNFSRIGGLGKPGSSGGFSLEMVNFIYAGFSFPVKVTGIKRVNLGVQMQKKLLFQDNPFNRFRTDYYDASGKSIGSDYFNGKHLAYSLVIGITL